MYNRVSNKYYITVLLYNQISELWALPRYTKHDVDFLK